LIALAVCAPAGPDEALEQRLRGHVEILASDAYEGRATGSPGERKAADYIAGVFDELGLEPAGRDGYRDPFAFRSGVSLAPGNRLKVLGIGSDDLEPGRDFQPIGFSESGSFGPAPVVFAGYGFAASTSDGVEAYDAYGSADVTRAWLLVLRFWPEGASEAERLHWRRYTSLRYKATLARHRGALGLLVANGPAAQTRHELIPLSLDDTAGSAGIPVVSVRDELADAILASTGHTLASLQANLDAGARNGPFLVPGIEIRAEVRLKSLQGEGTNVVGRLPGRDPAASALLVGAHFDHLGRGRGGRSLADEAERGRVHYGADDNASGVAALLEIARYVAAAPPARDVWFAAWSGEELGLLGSERFAKRFEAEGGDALVANPHGPDLSGRFVGYLNLDMVGRLREELIVHGVGSSSAWPDLVEASRDRVPVQLQDDAFLPTDAASFVVRRVPVLSLFTGAHADYHTPRDTADRVNYPGLAQITRLGAALTRSVADRAEPLDFVALAPPKGVSRGGLRAYLGTIPDYAAQVSGLRLAGVVAGGPAARAGLRAGDVVVSLGGREIRNIYDYTFAIEGLRLGEAESIAVLRGGARIELEITPASRQ